MVRSSACRASMRWAISSRLWLVTTRSMRCTRASRSFMRICTGSSAGDVAQPTSHAIARTTVIRSAMTDLAALALLEIDDLDPAIERIGLLIAAGRGGTFLAVAD